VLVSLAASALAASASNSAVLLSHCLLSSLPLFVSSSASSSPCSSFVSSPLTYPALHITETMETDDDVMKELKAEVSC
jgi:hypothetical protein